MQGYGKRCRNFLVYQWKFTYFTLEGKGVGKTMEILQGGHDRDEFLSVKEAAEILGVTPKTIRNRITDGRIAAVWNEVGKGKSQWLIPKDVIHADTTSAVEQVARVDQAQPVLFVEELKALFRAENESLRQELKAIQEKQERLESLVIEKDEQLRQLIEQQKEGRRWWKFWE